MRLGFIAWVRHRIQEPSTWMGVAIIAVVMGSDPTQAESLAQALSLIVGGGLVATARRRRPGQGPVDPGMPEVPAERSGCEEAGQCH